MQHGRDDYNDRIVDTVGLIPMREPVFLLRGQDYAAPAAVRAWALGHARRNGNPMQVWDALTIAMLMETWQTVVKGKVADWVEKRPGMWDQSKLMDLLQSRNAQFLAISERGGHGSAK